MSLENMIRGIAQEVMMQRGVARHGTVANVDPARALVRVTLDEEGTLSGWLPIAQHAAGNGWGVVTLPTPGQQVFMVPDMGDQSHLVVVGAVHFDTSPPGKVTPYKATEAIPLVPGEPTLLGPGGTSIRLPASGPIQIHGDVSVDGTLLVSGQIRDLDGVHGTVDDLRTAHNTHRHTNVGTGGGTSNIPTVVTP